MFLQQFLRFVLGVALLGIAAHFLGEAIPATAFRPDRFPYAPYRWENGGKVYLRIKIQKWKRFMPDKSKFVSSMEPKSMGASYSPEHTTRLGAETCRAELVHGVLLLLSPVFLFYLAPGYGAVYAALYALSHIPLLLIQRYNRPRLQKLSAHHHTPTEQNRSQLI